LFNIYIAIVVKYGVSKDDWYNISKKGITLGVGNKVKVLAL